MLLRRGFYIDFLLFPVIRHEIWTFVVLECKKFKPGKFLFQIKSPWWNTDLFSSFTSCGLSFDNRDILHFLFILCPSQIENSPLPHLLSAFFIPPANRHSPLRVLSNAGFCSIGSNTRFCSPSKPDLSGQHNWVRKELLICFCISPFHACFP